MANHVFRSCLVVCCMVGAGAFLVRPLPLVPTAVSRLDAGRFRTAVQVVRVQEEPELTVFDAGDVGVSWADYKKQKPNEFKLDEIDEMQCWKTDECPVEDSSRFTKAWRVRSAEREPTMETHFDSEGEWEEESVWSKKWHEDVGEDDLHEEVMSPSAKDGFGI